MRRSIDMRRLEQFVMVAREGSLGKAAAQLALSQPTLTRNIRSLEAEVGVKLFRRGPLGTVLTAAGERFLPRAEALINDAERALAELSDERPQAQLRLGISPNFYFDLLPQAIGQLVSADPTINVHIVSGTRELIADELRRNTIDLGLCLIPDFFYTAGSETSEVRFEAIGRDRIIPYAPPDHPAASTRTLEETEGCRWAVPHQLSVSYRFESAFYRHHLPVPVQSLNATSLSLLRGLALTEGFVALLPTRFAEPDVRTGLLTPLAIEALSFEAVMGFMQRADTALTPSATALCAIIREIIQTEEGTTET